MKAKVLITSVLLLLVLIFGVQNADVVEIKLLFWHTSMPRSLLIFMMIGIGVVIGWFSRSFIAASGKPR